VTIDHSFKVNTLQCNVLGCQCMVPIPNMQAITL